ncbi:hypothetical protein RFI_24937, partial [Reticulomyxa filosa]
MTNHAIVQSQFGIPQFEDFRSSNGTFREARKIRDELLSILDGYLMDYCVFYFLFEYIINKQILATIFSMCKYILVDTIVVVVVVVLEQTTVLLFFFVTFLKKKKKTNSEKIKYEDYAYFFFKVNHFPELYSIPYSQHQAVYTASNSNSNSNGNSNSNSNSNSNNNNKANLDGSYRHMSNKYDNNKANQTTMTGDH